MAPVRYEKDEVNGSPSYLGPTSPGPGKVCRHQAVPTVGCCMDDHPRSVPIGIQHGRRNVGGYVDSSPNGRNASALCTTTSPIPKGFEEPPERRRSSAALRSRSASSGTVHPAESLGRFVHRVVGSESTSKQVTHQRPRSGLSIPYKVGEHVTHLPSRTPGRFIPRCLVQGHNAVGKLAT